MYFPSSSMQTFAGVCHAPNNSPVAGRIVFSENGLPPKREPCFAVVRSLRESSRWDTENLVGILRIGSAEPVSGSATLPCPILTLSHLPPESDGKIALLDPSRATLFVSPDIGVFNRLVHRLSPTPQAERKQPLRLPDGAVLRLGTVLSADACFPSSEMESALFPPPSVFEEEDALYEGYRDLAESAIGIPLTVTALCPRAQADGSLLHRQLRALFRSAVFGNFSLLMKGALTSQDRKSVLWEIRQVTDELRQEGREFNGSIPLGLLLDVPLLLHGSDLSEFNFLCIDLDHLWDLITGYSPRTDKEICRAFTQALRESLPKQSLPCTSVIANRVSSLWAISSLWSQWEITDCFVPPALRADAYDELSRILSKKEQI